MIGQEDEELGRASAKQAVIDHVRAAIGDGALKPGQKVRERELVEACQVSRSAVREALVALISEGALTRMPGRSPVVRQFTRAELWAQQQIFEALEGLAAGLAATCHNQDQFHGRLAEIKQALDQAVADRDATAFMRADEAFHAVIAEMSGNPLIKTYMEQSGSAQMRRQATDYIDVSRLAEIHQGHDEMLDAIVRGDAVAAEAAMRSHVRGARLTFVAIPDSLFLGEAAASA